MKLPVHTHVPFRAKLTPRTSPAPLWLRSPLRIQFFFNQSWSTPAAEAIPQKNWPFKKSCLCRPISSSNSRSPTRPRWSPYRAAVPATIEQYGGRFLTRGGATELIEGGPEPKRIVILELADTAAFKRWYNSPEYQKILPGRLDNSTGRAFIVEGVS
jgi:uncharacterized protein (DUF1330 family)